MTTRARAIKFALELGADAARRKEIRRLFNKGSKMTANDHLRAYYDDRAVEAMAMAYRPPVGFAFLQLDAVGTRR